MRKHGRLHAGTTHLVYRCGTDAQWEACSEGCLTRGGLALTGSQNAAKQHLINQSDVDPGPPEGGTDGGRTKLHGGDVL
ncbi:hypothetical protein MesoLj113c_63480 [Mesorhizobium sp. 113-3-9]|nr:hypothetical protein MesoLj113c_63480 [Mesorhizobium sp. 113-3-9]